MLELYRSLLFIIKASFRLLWLHTLKKLLQVVRFFLSLLRWGIFRDYLGVSKGVATTCLDTPTALAAFLHSRASQVAQTSLYGYIKTRAGTRYPELFTNKSMLASINIAKWHVYLACLSDLMVYSGVLLHHRTDAPDKQIHTLLTKLFALVMGEVGHPKEAGDAFLAAAQKVRTRVTNVRFAGLQDDASVFTESPQALLYWSPIADELKSRDAEVIYNSIRFRWLEIRRSLRSQLHAETLIRNAH